ncbi:MAG: hypothetical protein M3071_00870, partial [Actinomycetota bacterium]|nr:hypothetical protein [Actinomycetota bacterium]
AAAAAAGSFVWSAPRLVDSHRPYGAGNAINAVSCPSVRLCVAVDGGAGYMETEQGTAGQVMVSVHPEGGTGAWKVSRIDGNTTLTGVSCPSVSLCVATDWVGRVLVSIDPNGGPRAWRSARVDRGHTLTAVSCPTVRCASRSMVRGTS